MKHLSKECKNIQQANKYLASIGLEDFTVDPEIVTEFDFDGWIDSEETKGVSIQITKQFEVLVTKYTKKDLFELEKELN